MRISPIYKVIAFTVVLFVLAVFSPTAAMAAQPDDFTYTVVGNTVQITKYTGTAATVEIPSIIDGKSVTSIGDFAFAYCYGLEGVVVPSSVTSIGEYAFCGSNRLTDIAIPSSVTSIGMGAFMNCIALTDASLPNSLTSIEQHVFDGCTNLISITIPIGVTSIGNAAFINCCSMTSVIIPPGVTSIGNNVFKGCSKLTSVTIPASVKSIGTSAFTNSTRLGRVIFEGNMPTIGASAFDGCASGFKVYYHTYCASTWAGYTSYATQEYCIVTVQQSPGARFRAIADINNGHIEAPVPIHRLGYTLQGWYKEDTCKNPWNFSTAVIGSDITVYAKWTINTYNVTFDSQGGSPVSGEIADYNSTITPPTSPTRVGYKFLGWYKEPACTNAWDFAASKVTGNITLYAKWTNIFTVSFNSQGGTAVAGKTATDNSLITAPASPTRAGYTFAGWYKQTACTSAWNFASDKVAANITLYAGWTAAPKCAVTVQANNARYGTVSGGGSYYNDKVTQATVTAIPKAGYRFVRWLEGTTAVSASYKYSFLVTRARTLKAEFARIGVPAITTASAGYDRIKISWAAVVGAAGYEVYRAASSGGSYVKVGTTASASYTDTGLKTNKKYFYKVRVKCAAGTVITYGPYSAYKSAVPVPSAPTGVAAARASATGITISWNAVAGATKYEVYRALSSTGTYSRVSTTASRSFKNTGLVTGKYYYYKVRAYHLEGSVKVYGKFSAVVYVKP